jgi:hypothetical protein
MLELSFYTLDVRATCEDDTLALQQLGAAASEALRHRIEDLRAADTVFDVLVGCLRLDDKSADRSVYMLDLADGWILRFRAKLAKLPVTPNGMVDWSQVGRVQIMDILRADNIPNRQSDV